MHTVRVVRGEEVGGCCENGHGHGVDQRSEPQDCSEELRALMEKNSLWVTLWEDGSDEHTRRQDYDET